MSRWWSEEQPRRLALLMEKDLPLDEAETCEAARASDEEGSGGGSDDDELDASDLTGSALLAALLRDAPR